LMGNEVCISLSISFIISLTHEPNSGYDFHLASFPYPSNYFPQFKHHHSGIKTE
jgi:hypothetical protein